MNSEAVTTIPAYYDVTTLEVIDESWLKLSYNDYTGYILCNYLTSETLTPNIVELCKKAKIQNNLDINMSLNKASRLNRARLQKNLAKSFTRHKPHFQR
jgi:hypothetical protein